MSSNIVNQVAYLRTSREFPDELHQLSVEVNKMYVDMYMRNLVGKFTATTAIDHNIKGTTPGQFINCFGSYTDATNTYGLIFGTSVAIAGQITFYVTPTQIVFVVGGGAPALTSGIIVLEWLSQS